MIEPYELPDGPGEGDPGVDAAASDPCYWTGWGCGAMSCAPGNSIHGVDFNANRSEGCWGDDNDYDEPRRRIQCCDAPPLTGGCYWSGWGCGAMTCPDGHVMTGIDFNANQSEGCWGDDNDYDEPRRRIQCCSSRAPLTDCYWTGWACGEMVCAGGYASRGVDFNAHQSEGCWGDDSDYDEPVRQVLCCR